MKVIINEKELNVSCGVTAYDAAREAELIDRSVIAVKINNVVRALTTELKEGDVCQLLTFESADGKHVFWHSASHLLAQAMKRLYPDTKLTIGPAIESGFYYDFDSSVPVTPDVLT